jgi:hypothetical protein
MDAIPGERLRWGRQVNPWPVIYKRLGKDKRVDWAITGDGSVNRHTPPSGWDMRCAPPRTRFLLSYSAVF